MVGNPKPQSRTLAAATYVATQLAGSEPDLVVDLADLGPALLDWSDPTVAGLVEEVGAADPAAYESWLAAARRHVRLPEVDRA